MPNESSCEMKEANPAPFLETNFHIPQIAVRVFDHPFCAQVGEEPPQKHFGVTITSSHPILNEVLQTLGPLLVQLLPILLAGLLDEPTLPASPPSTN